MMRVSDLGYHLLVCHEMDAKLLLSTPMNKRPVFQFNGISLFDTGFELDQVEKALGTILNLKVRRYLDKFYLWLPEEDLPRRQEVIEKFFGLIADEYESLIDTQRNLENIGILLGFLVQLMKSLNNSTIIDYGCGTGLSLGPASALKIKLIGVDPSSAMRSIATSKGMMTWSPGNLARQPKNSLDAGFASYVFHLIPHMHGLRLLWSRLKPGGVIVANFHKDQGLEAVEQCIQNLQGSVRYLMPPNASERHGSYVALIK